MLILLCARALRAPAVVDDVMAEFPDVLAKFKAVAEQRLMQDGEIPKWMQKVRRHQHVHPDCLDRVPSDCLDRVPSRLSR